MYRYALCVSFVPVSTLPGTMATVAAVVCQALKGNHNFSHSRRKSKHDELFHTRSVEMHLIVKHNTTCRNNEQGESYVHELPGQAIFESSYHLSLIHI